MSVFVEKSEIHTVGLAQAESIGIHKSSMVGVSYKINVGHEMTVSVGDELAIGVGQSKLIMQKDGTIHLVGVKIFVEGSEKVEVNGEVVKIN